MCLGIPYEVVEVIDAESCLIEAEDGLEHCFLGLVQDVRPGDWLIVQSFFAVEKVDAEEARARRDLIHRYLHAGALPRPGRTAEEGLQGE